MQTSSRVDRDDTVVGVGRGGRRSLVKQGGETRPDAQPFNPPPTPPKKLTRAPPHRSECAHGILSVCLSPVVQRGTWCVRIHV